MKNLKTFLFAFVCVIVCFVLQSTLLTRLTLGGVQANLMIIETAAFAFCLGDVGGLFVGFFSGLLCDIFFGPLIGFYALIYAFIGFLAGKFKRLLYAEDLAFPLALVGGCDLMYSFLSFVFLFMMRNRMILPDFFLQCMLPELIYTLVLSIPCYPAITKLYGLVTKPRRKHRKTTHSGQDSLFR